MNKYKEIHQNIRKNSFAIDSGTGSDDDKIKYFDEIIQQLKEKYSRPDTTRYEKLQLLTARLMDGPENYGYIWCLQIHGNTGQRAFGRKRAHIWEAFTNEH